MSSNYNSSRVWPEMNARHEEIFADCARTYAYTRYRYRGTGNDGQWNKTRSFSLPLIFWMKFSIRIFPIHIQAKLCDRYLYLCMFYGVFINNFSFKKIFLLLIFLFLSFSGNPKFFFRHKSFDRGEKLKYTYVHFFRPISFLLSLKQLKR